jgi:hypothetical protein
MTVLLRVKRSTEAGSRLRPRPRRVFEPPARPGRRAATPAGAERELGTDPRTPPTEDRATYNCACGFVFSDDVSTSVACPHCGDAQAW